MDGNDINKERINAINRLLDRLEKIPKELDAIHEKLFNTSGFSAEEFAKMVDRRNNLIIEYDRVERKLKETYNVKI